MKSFCPKKALLIMLGLLFTSIMGPFKVKAAGEYFKVMSWKFYKGTTSTAAGMKYANGHYYVTDSNVSIQYYGYYVLEGDYPGSLYDVSCELKVNGGDVSVAADKDSSAYEEYNGKNAVKIVCKQSAAFTLRKGANTVQPGGAFVAMAGSPVPFPTKYDSLTIYYDPDKPIATLKFVSYPTGSKCTKSELLARSSDCKVKVEYSVKDVSGFMQEATLSFWQGGKSSTPVSIPGQQQNGTKQYYTVDLKEFGISTSGTYKIYFKISGKDEVGNSTSKTVSATVSVTADASASGSSADSSKDKGDSNDTKDESKPTQMQPPEASAQEGTPTETKDTETTSKSGKNGIVLFLGASALWVLISVLGFFAYKRFLKA